MSTEPLKIIIFCEFLLLCLASASTRSLPIDKRSIRSLSVDNRSLPVDKRSTRMSRMPIYYGKRSAAAVADDLPPAQYWLDRMRSFNDVALRSTAIQDKQSVYQHENARVVNGYLISGDHPPRILRLDNYYSSKNQVPVQEYPSQGVSGKRTFNTLSRMPGYYGKRSSIRSDKSDELSLFEEYRKRKSLFALPHMPDLYGNRVQKYSSWDHFKPPNFDIMKRNSLIRMPGFFGKRAYSYAESQSTNENVMNTLIRELQTHEESHIPRLYTVASRLSTADRTKPINTDSNIFNQPYARNKIEDDITDKHLDQDSPNIKSFITDNTEDEEHDNSKYEDGEINTLPDNPDSPGNENTNSEFSKRRTLSTLDRMPNFFGKREAALLVDIPDVIRNIYKKQKYEIHNSNELQNVKLANLLAQHSTQSDNLEHTLNAIKPQYQTAGQHNNNGFEISPNTKISTILHTRT